MSDFDDDDLADELLELAGASGSKERRKSSSKSRGSKKRKVDSDSDHDVESEEDGGSSGDEDWDNGDKYTYEGIYIDAEDKEMLLGLPEIEREGILADREDEKRRLQEKRVLAQMVKQQKGGAGAGLDDDNVARAAKRQHMARGATKEKSRKLDELKAKRKAQDESRKRAKLSPKSHRDRSASPQDMDISSDESEDGMVTREEQEEERERRLLGITKKEEDPEEHSDASLEDFNRTRLTRDLVAKYCMNPWFEDYVTGTYVRYLIGNEHGEPVYRICEVANLSAELVKPYKVNDKLVNQAVDLRHGKSTKQWNMDRVSNSQFTEREYNRLRTVCREDKVKFPTKGEMQKKREQMRKLEAQPLTDKDITAILKRKRELQSMQNSSRNVNELKFERNKLNQARSLALKRYDDDEVASLDRQIAALQQQIDAGMGVESPAAGDSREETLHKVNERNRKANAEAIRKAELAEAERKKREREMAKIAAKEGAAPAAVRYDPSARLKTMPRMFNAATPSTRPGTPAVASQGGTPGPSEMGTSPGPNGSKPLSVVGRPSAVSSQIALEQKLLDTIDIDLGDF